MTTITENRTESGILIAYGYRMRNYVIILECPICHQRHIHGYHRSEIIDGILTAGLRVPHCTNVTNKEEYLLVLESDLFGENTDFFPC